MTMNYSQKKRAKQDGNTSNGGSPESRKVTKNNEVPNSEEWEKQIWFWRTHLDIFIEEYFSWGLSTDETPISFYPFQKVIVRACGNCILVDDVESRGLGKTWKMSVVLLALGILYPGSKILVVSKTVKQAILTIKYIDNLAKNNSNVSREIIHPIKISKDEGVVNLKSGSEIVALAMNSDGSNIRGRREKIVYIDEAAWVKSNVIKDVITPMLLYKRDIWWKLKDEGFEDYQSKLIQSSSAYVKACDFFQRFKNNLTSIRKGDDLKFACAINYKTGIRHGIAEEKTIESEKETMPLSSFEMEYGAKFIGSSEGSYFPYDLTEPCRNLQHIELKQPTGSKSRYILSCDIATSAAKTADNACICITKIAEKTDGTFNKYLVFIRSYHGYQLESLANEIRKLCIRFPNIEKLIIDINAIGEGILALLNTPYVDDNNKEYLPFVLDSIDTYKGNVLPIIRGVKADTKMNGRMATATRMYLENKSLHIPVSSADMRREIDAGNLDNDDKKAKTENKRQLMLEEVSVFVDADGLQFEMGNITSRLTANGNVIYDTELTTQHKDRYTTLGMAMEYIFELEEKNKENMRDNDGNECWGVATTF